jgi:Protein of unknown function (DUF1569)
MKTLFDPVAYEEVMQRLDAVRADSPRQWGKMTPAQMLEHTARALEMAAGRKQIKQAWLGKLIGWTVWKDFAGEKPFPKSSPTGPYFVVLGTDPEFAATRERLRALLREFHAMGEKGCDGNVHGFFGRMSGADWGITQYKHFDHHLRQFGV